MQLYASQHSQQLLPLCRSPRTLACRDTTDDHRAMLHNGQCQLSQPGRGHCQRFMREQSQLRHQRRLEHPRARIIKRDSNVFNWRAAGYTRCGDMPASVSVIVTRIGTSNCWAPSVQSASNSKSIYFNTAMSWKLILQHHLNTDLDHL